MSSMSGGQKTDSVNNGNLRTEYGNNRMIVNDGSDDRLIMGQEDDGDIVFKVSQPGYDVKTATDERLSFSSQFNALKIVQSGTVSLVKGANTASVTANVTHNLGYRPVVFAYTDGGTIFGAGMPLPATWFMQLVGVTAGGCAELTDASLRFGIGTTQVSFTFETPFWGAAWPATKYHQAHTQNVKYYIMADSAI